MYGRIFSAERDGFGSMVDACDWACEKLEAMESDEDISLWYDDIKLETLREAMPVPTTFEDDETVAFSR